jgi:hypothetical protein
MVCLMGRLDRKGLHWCVRCFSWWLEDPDEHIIIRCTDFGDAQNAGAHAIKGCPNCTVVVSGKKVTTVSGNFIEEDADLRRGLCTVIRKPKKL